MKKRIISLVMALAMVVTMLPVTAWASNAYTINGKVVHWDDVSSSSGECWAYANGIYNKIWGCGFSSEFATSDNMLRNLSDGQLALTAENLKLFVSAAAIGSCLRICNAQNLHSHDGYVSGNPGHNQIIVQKDNNGFTVFEGGLSAAPYCREKYFTWSEYINTSWLGGQYHYIKYIKWPGAPAYTPYYNPQGVLDNTEGGAGTVRIRGWAFDRDDPTRSLEIHAYVGGMDVTNGEGHGGIIANGYRDDVGIAYPGVGDYHGYDVTFTTALRGTQPVYVYAINVGGGENKLIGQATVTISDPYHLDVNAYLDGQYYPNSFDTFAKVDVSIGDGAYNYNDVSDYYAAWPDGTTYEVKVQPKDGYVFKGARTGTCEGFIASGLTGTINGGDVYVFLDFETKSCQHNWGRGTVTTAPTCTTAGVRKYTCSLCGETKTETIAALGHNMTLTAGKEANCTEPGYLPYYTCSRCNGVFKDKAGSTATTVAAMTLPALGHNYENGVCTRCNQPENSNAMKVTVESKKAAAGGTVDVTIQIENNPGIAMTQFKVGFDDALSLQSVDAGSIFSASELTPGATGSNPYTVMFVRTSGNLSEDGTLATLHFKVADTAVEDSVHTVTISGMASDIDEHPITIAFTNGSITIKSVIYGDVNGDEEVNGLDVLRLGKYLTGWNVTIDQDAADVNCDGEINGLDQLRLAKYCTGWPVTLGS